MPLYEYQCDSCGALFELIRKFADPPLEACPTCGGTVQKLVSSPAFQFKGSGFYATDYAKKAGASAGAGDSSKAGNTENSEKSEKAEKTEKTEKAEKTDKADAASAASKDSGTTAGEKPAALPAGSSTKSSKDQ